MIFFLANFGFFKCKLEGECLNSWKNHQTFKSYKIEIKIKINS